MKDNMMIKRSRHHHGTAQKHLAIPEYTQMAITYAHQAVHARLLGNLDYAKECEARSAAYADAARECSQGLGHIDEDGQHSYRDFPEYLNEAFDEGDCR